jgi:hypothetical protein
MRGHADRREVFWKSFQDTTEEGTPVELIMRTDDDDAETFQWALGREQHGQVIRGPQYEGYRSLPRFFNEMAGIADGDLLMCGNDDMVFKTEHWVEDLLGAANHYPDGVFNIGTYTFPAGSFPFSCVSKVAVETLGFLNDVRLVYSDIFLRDVMARFGRAVLLPRTVIQHVGVADVDAQQTKLDIHHDAEAYWTLHEQCVNEAVAKLEPLMAVKA